MQYNVGDKVKFHVDIMREEPVEGEILEIFEKYNKYKISYEGSWFCVHERFIVNKIIDDKIMIKL